MTNNAHSLLLTKRDDVIEADLERAAIIGNETDPLRAVGRVDVRDLSAAALRHAFEVELQLDAVLVHRRRLELVVVVAGDRFVMLFGHSLPPAGSYAEAVPFIHAIVRPSLGDRDASHLRGRAAPDPDHFVPLACGRLLPVPRADDRDRAEAGGRPARVSREREERRPRALPRPHHPRGPETRADRGSGSERQHVKGSRVASRVCASKLWRKYHV